MNCPECNEQVEQEDLFCPYCGVKVRWDQLQVHYSELGPRIGAALVDLVYTMVPAGILTIMIRANVYEAIPLMLGFHAAYIIGFTAFRGQTPGMKGAEIFVVTKDFKRLGLVKATVRYILGILSTVTILGALYGAFQEHRQTAYDMATGSYVVKFETR